MLTPTWIYSILVNELWIHLVVKWNSMKLASLLSVASDFNCVWCERQKLPQDDSLLIIPIFVKQDILQLLSGLDSLVRRKPLWHCKVVDCLRFQMLRYCWIGLKYSDLDIQHLIVSPTDFCKIESRMTLLWETFPSASGIGWPSFL